jgi:hypothetical protein
MTDKKTFDQLKAETFAGDLINTLNKSALSLMTSIGHRSGLFDTMAEMDFATLLRLQIKQLLMNAM